MTWKSGKIERVDNVSAWRLCMGCGACAWACPNDAVSLTNIIDTGIRPVIDESKCEHCRQCLAVCPGIELGHEQFASSTLPELQQGWGPVLELWEGYAGDDEIRYAASSGGVATALARYALEKGRFSGILHIAPDPKRPLENVPVFSSNVGDLLRTTGSRYAPAAPCQAFDKIKNTNGPCMFIGKPCDVAALSKACRMDEELDSKVALTVSIFCAGTPSTQGTLALLQAMGVENPEDLVDFRYRGNGWPGLARARLQDNREFTMTYAQAWGDILSKHGQLRCRLCPDSTGEFADIACGDPWYRQIEPDEVGRSLVLARTQKGKVFLHQAKAAQFLLLEKVQADILPRSQESVYNRRQQLWGRLTALRIFGIPVVKLAGFSLFANWLKLPWRTRIKSILGTIRRIITRKWYKPVKLQPDEV